MFTCGAGDSGQLGTGAREAELEPKDISNIFKEKVFEISAGLSHTCALTDKGVIWTFGGNGPKKNSPVPIKVKDSEQIKFKKVSCWNHTSAISTEGELYVWKSGDQSNLEKITLPGVKIQDISIGATFGAALDENGKLWTWGSNSAGELGVGDYEPRETPLKIPQLDSKTVVTFSCGGSYAIALGVTHTIGGACNDKMENVITQVLNQSSRCSAESYNTLAHITEKKTENTKEFNVNQSVGSRKDSVESEEIKDISSKNISNGNRLQVSTQQAQEIPSVSDMNTAEIISSVSQRDPHHTV